MENERKVHIGETYKHFKGNCYKVVAVGVKDTETGEELVIYRKDDNPSLMYARPLKMFLSKVDKDKYPDVKQEYRFERVCTATVPITVGSTEQMVAYLEQILDENNKSVCIDREDKEARALTIRTCIELCRKVHSIRELITRKDGQKAIKELCNKYDIAYGDRKRNYEDTASYALARVMETVVPAIDRSHWKSRRNTQ